jgi:hypothetical protein
MRKLKLYFHFYKSKFFITLVFCLFILIKYQNLLLALISLTLASLGVWFVQHYINDKKKESLYFYFNSGISEFKLYFFTFVVNLSILIITNNIFK